MTEDKIRRDMKGLIVFILIIVILAFSAYFGTLWFINTKGKDIFAAKIEETFGAQAEVGSLSFKFPFNIEIKDFVCEDISFKRANIFGGVYNPFLSHLTLKSVTVTGLKVKAVRDRRGIHIKPVYAGQILKSQRQMRVSGNRGFIVQNAFAEDIEDDSAQEEEAKAFSLKIGNFYIKDGEVEFIDKSRRKKVLTFKDINLRVRNFTYPKLAKFNVKLDTYLYGGPSGENNLLEASGWIDYSNKNMNINIAAQELNCYTFYDYYPNFWKPDRFGVEQALLSLHTNVNSAHNELVIDGTLALETISFVEETEENADKMNYLRTVLALLKGNKDKPSLNVKLKTKMDSPKLDFSSVKNNFKGIVSIGMGMTFLEDALAGEKKPEEGEEADSGDKTVNAIKDVVESLKDLF
jgi:hypothetical protein